MASWRQDQVKYTFAQRVCLSFLLLFILNSPAFAAITWDAGGNSQWWFNPVNWNVTGGPNNVLPPTSNTATATDTQINIGTGAWDLGEGVVYDPANDPFFGAAGGLTYPSGFGPQTIRELYMSRNNPATNKLTIKGDLTLLERWHIGRSSGTRGTGAQGIVVQKGGTVTQTVRETDLGQTDTSNPGYGNGTYDYRAGILDIGTQGGNGLRLSVGSNSVVGTDGLKAGPGGIGKFIVHNPSTAGRIRVKSLTSAQFAGFQEGSLPDGSDSTFDAAYDANGVTTGVSIFEFHYANGGTRAIQVREGMSLNNGVDQTTRGIRSSRLDFVVDQAACSGAACVPNNVGLFDIDFDGNGFALLGAGDLNNNGSYIDDRVFSNITDTADYREGDMVSATFGSTQYNWTISYTGNITWSNADNSVLGSVTGTGTGTDIVLIGHSSVSAGTPGDFDNDGDVDGRDFLAWQRGNSPTPFSSGDLSTWQTAYNGGALAGIGSVPEPTSLVLLCAALLPLTGRRRS